MNRPHEEFMRTHIGKVLTLIDLHSQFKSGNVATEGVQEVTSMKQIPGFL